MFGIQYYDAATRKFTTVKDATNIAFAKAEAAASKYASKSKKMSGMLAGGWTLHGYEDEGTQGYYAHKLFEGLKALVINGLLYGVADPKQVDENGNAKIVPLVDSKNLPADMDERKRVFERMFEGPEYQGNADYPPTMQGRARYFVETDKNADGAEYEYVALATDVKNAEFVGVKVVTPGEDLVPKPEHFEWLRPKHRSIVVLDVLPVKFAKKDIKQKLELAKTIVVPFKRARYADAEVVADDDDVDDSDNIALE